MAMTTVLLSLFLLSATVGAAPSPVQNTNPPSLLSTILSTLGFQELSATAAADTNLTTATPTTVFAPTDSSLLTCPSCSLPLLLQEHSIPGLYPLHFLRSLAFGTKIETLAPNRCLTVTTTAIGAAEAAATRKVFINGVEISKPDLFNNGLIIIHGLQGFISHLSPLSCAVERLNSLAFLPQSSPPAPLFFIMRLMLKDAMSKLRVRGYSLVALAIRVKYPALSDLQSMTIFALDDVATFSGGGGYSYVAELGFHTVPNRLLKAADLVGLPPGTELPNMERGQSLVVTTAGGKGPLKPMRINYTKIKKFDLVVNERIVVHGLSKPFPHVKHPTVDMGNDGIEGYDLEEDWIHEMAPVSQPASMMDIEDHHSL